MRISSSPWGTPQKHTQHGEGIHEISTASHGGFYLEPGMRARMPEPLQAFTTWAAGDWFEEDMDWAIVVAAFPERFTPHHAHYALRALTGCEYYAKRGVDVSSYLESPTGQALKALAARHGAAA